MVSLNKEEDDFYPTEPQHIAEDGFSRQLPDNCVEYMLFLIDQRGGPKAQKTTTLLSALEAIKKEAIQVGNELTSLGDGERYIWQRSEGFRLELRSRDGLAYLWGSTDYGDAVEDEWLVV
ncbi:MAG: hypothetical protein OK454_04335, partial [Thaumarchaeota archaeon]|nr:hypothetical protein [Nitrososphaerota archaeon]